MSNENEAPARLPGTIWPRDGEAWPTYAGAPCCVTRSGDGSLVAWTWAGERWGCVHAPQGAIFAAWAMAERVAREKAEASNRTLRESHAVALTLAQGEANEQFLRLAKAERAYRVARDRYEDHGGTVEWDAVTKARAAILAAGGTP